MASVQFQLGPLDGLAIDFQAIGFGPRIPERLALKLSRQLGGPGVAYYDLSQGWVCYLFAGWHDNGSAGETSVA